MCENRISTSEKTCRFPNCKAPRYDGSMLCAMHEVQSLREAIERERLKKKRLEFKERK
jgi:hypothetical protein